MVGNHDSPQARIIESNGRCWRGVQFVERYARPPGVLPLTITSELRGISGRGGSGSARVMGENSAELVDCEFKAKLQELDAMS